MSEHDELGPWSTVEQLVRTLRLPAGEADDLVSRIVGEAVRMVPAARHAGVIVTDSAKNVRTVFASHAVPRQLDALQIQIGTGPCLTAARKQIVVRMHDIAADTRWSDFRRAAKECDVGSMLCVPLYIDDQLLGTLSFYGEQPDVFRVGAEPIARLLATLSAVALADSFQRERMERALRNRDVIGQAKGILMERLKLTNQEAFATLVRASQKHNIKLRVLSEQLIDTGVWPR